jgi:site-specific recombinase XerD
MQSSHVRHMVARRGLKAGVTVRCHPHQLRHSFASELLEDGYSILSVQRLLGHEDLETTAVYLSLVDEELRVRLLERPG